MSGWLVCATAIRWREMLRFVQQQAGNVKLRPDNKLIYQRQWNDSRVRLAGVRRLLGDLAKLAA